MLGAIYVLLSIATLFYAPVNFFLIVVAISSTQAQFKFSVTNCLASNPQTNCNCTCDKARIRSVVAAQCVV